MTKEKNNKVLILSLGAGRYDREKKKMLEPENLSAENAGKLEEKVRTSFENRNDKSKNNVYTITTYSAPNADMPGEIELFEETPFVAEPLIKITDPDHVVVIGSVRSAWSSFYMGLAASPSLAMYRELFNIENGDVYSIEDDRLSYDEQKCRNAGACGILTGDAELDRYECRINEIFALSGGIKVSGAEAKTNVHVVLIRYGVDDEQQSENYGRFKKIRESLDHNAVNRISFDISHSFRSIPFYNLVLLNYIETIEDYEIRIEHVFNGCFEAKDESLMLWPQMGKEQVAPILDLHGVIDLLELTDAVREFMNTGNAVALTARRRKSDSESEFLEDLGLFDWATQTNDFRLIEKAIDNLSGYEELLSESGEEQKMETAITDRTKMILSVISRKMLDGRRLREFSELAAAEKRLVIAEWYQEQNRYGQAIATGIEAMRSLIVPYHLEYKKINKTEQMEEDENRRREAETRLGCISDNLKKKQTDYSDQSIERLVIDLVEDFRRVRPIRNMFAHNLKSEERTPCTAGESNLDRGYTDDKSEYNYSFSKGAIQSFLIHLRLLFERIERGKAEGEALSEEFQQLYEEKITIDKPTGEPDDRIGGAVIIMNPDPYESGDYEEFLKKRIKGFETKEKYKLPSVFSNIGKSAMLAKCAAGYLQKYFIEKSGTIVICTNSLKNVKYLVPMLKSFSFKSVYALILRKEESPNLVGFPKDFFDRDYLEGLKCVHVPDNISRDYENLEAPLRY